MFIRFKDDTRVKNNGGSEYPQRLQCKGVHEGRGHIRYHQSDTRGEHDRGGVLHRGHRKGGSSGSKLERTPSEHKALLRRKSESERARAQSPRWSRRQF